MKEIPTTIRDEKEYDAVYEELLRLVDAETVSPDEARLYVLVDLLTAYDDEHYPIPAPSWIEFIQYHAERIIEREVARIRKWIERMTR